ncbi:MAG: hypothetical protein IJ193_08045 [Bacilli bacterium]|nr:hypothetical protein [Bacilli bacterium]
MDNETTGNREWLSFGNRGSGITIGGLSYLYGLNGLSSLYWYTATTIYLSSETIRISQYESYGDMRHSYGSTYGIIAIYSNHLSFYRFQLATGGKSIF